MKHYKQNQQYNCIPNIDPQSRKTSNLSKKIRKEPRFNLEDLFNMYAKEEQKLIISTDIATGTSIFITW